MKIKSILQILAGLVILGVLFLVGVSPMLLMALVMILFIRGVYVRLSLLKEENKMDDTGMEESITGEAIER